MGIYEIDAKVKELRELRNMEAEVKSAITAIEDSLKAEMLAKNTDVLSGKGRGFDLKKVTGKMKCKKRRKNQDAFMHGRVSIMVATNAFGLGVDKPDVRLVIHMGLPLTLEGYVQEIGRAGRDGKKSTCVLLYTQSDYKRNKRILKAGGEEAFQWFEQGMKAMHGFADDKTTCAWRKIEKYFGEKSSKRCRVCSNCIAKKLIG